MATIDLPLSDAIRPVTFHVRVTGVRRAKIRLWLGMKIMQIAALIIGCGVDVAIDPAAKPDLA